MYIDGWVRSLDSISSKLALLAPVLALATRVYVGWVFLKSGFLKAADWDSTLFLFREEYRVPWLAPDLAAILGTAGELLFGTLVIAGLFGRLSVIGLFVVNAIAVVSYSHVLLSEGFEAAIAQHYLWGYMLLVLAVYGPGGLSADRFLKRRARGATSTTARGTTITP